MGDGTKHSLPEVRPPLQPGMDVPFDSTFKAHSRSRLAVVQPGDRQLKDASESPSRMKFRATTAGSESCASNACSSVDCGEDLLISPGSTRLCPGAERHVKYSQSAGCLPRASNFSELIPATVSIDGIGRSTSLPGRRPSILDRNLPKFTVTGSTGEMHLVVDITEALLVIINSNLLKHAYGVKQVIKLICHSRDDTKLTLHLRDRPEEDLKFSQARERHDFCLLVFEMKKSLPETFESKTLSVYVGSFNMGNAMPPPDLRAWFECQGEGRSLDTTLAAIPHDIYVFGTQETCQMNPSDWVTKLSQLLIAYTSTAFKAVAHDTLWGLRMVIFCRSDVASRVSDVETLTVKTGVANKLGNKGGVAISLKVDTTSFCFVCAHLTSGAEKLQRRNNNIRDILKNLTIGRKQRVHPDLEPRFDHIFWLGDLNYRLEGDDAESIIEKIRERKYDELQRKDQFRTERLNGNIFTRFEEDEIAFAPTYRYSIGTRASYHYRKEKKMSVRINVPSWCDRVLRRSSPRLFTESRAYGCTTNVMTSDHSPLFSSFNVSIEASPSLPLQTRFDAKVRAFTKLGFFKCMISSASKGPFHLEFLSLGFHESGVSGGNARWMAKTENQQLSDCMVRFSLRERISIDTANTQYPYWETPQMAPVSVSPHSYAKSFLQDQVITLAVVNSEDEVIGSGDLPLAPYLAADPVNLELLLERYGKAVGFLAGSMCFNVAQEHRTQSCVSLASIPTVVMDTDIAGHFGGDRRLGNLQEDDDECEPYTRRRRVQSFFTVRPVLRFVECNNFGAPEDH